ncbi:MAG TPA: rRNA maturation RNase YbeY [Candidatus Udaeobacter sp.]|nr:rRNA maturation RNase YbeY [Candidatus Udaeobacter sp.]
MLSIDFNKRVRCSWARKDIEAIFKIIQKKVKINSAKNNKSEPIELEINIVDDKEIKDLNFRYRGLKKVTDVLSFAWQEDGIIKTDSLGQIYICYPQIVRQAKELSIKSKEEFVRMLAHGFLHIIGYDHVKKKDAVIMFGIQEEIVAEYFA